MAVCLRGVGMQSSSCGGAGQVAVWSVLMTSRGGVVHDVHGVFSIAVFWHTRKATSETAFQKKAYLTVCWSSALLYSLGASWRVSNRGAPPEEIQQTPLSGNVLHRWSTTPVVLKCCGGVALFLQHHWSSMAKSTCLFGGVYRWYVAV